ncbi:MAG: pyruvate kinase, partial [Patescibacteria group bacterium]
VSGMNVARINFSHGTHDSNGELIDKVRELREESQKPIGILADLQGPRIRVLVEEDLPVEIGETIFIGSSSLEELKIQNSKIKDSIQNSKLFFLDKDILDCVEVGNEILIEDGKIKLEIIEKKDGILLSMVVVPGTIKNHKGVNIPDAKLNFGAMTEKDDEDLKFVLSKNVDFVALSFVGGAEDIENLRKKIKNILGEREVYPKIVAKIERKEALRNIDEIIEATDSVMVARGDLGIELPETKVVIYQKEIIEKCLAKNKPVIVATQMLETMIQNPLPTRAEVSDVTNAVIDHADAVMLSGESANGKYPVEAVATMAQIIKDTEESRFDDHFKKFFDHDDLDEYKAVVDSAHELAKKSHAKAILTFSFWGNTPLFISQHRPKQLIFSATDNPEAYYQTAILWGVRGFLLEEGEDIDDFMNILSSIALDQGRLKKGDKVVVIMGKLPGGEKMRLLGIKEV